jgi:N6-L-threonylcarbamoyladenine synthase
MQKLIRRHLKMQKFELKLKNVPKDASQVLCSTNNQLNKEEILSADSIVLDSNNSDVNQSQHTERSLKSKVYVISKQGKPLMPCSYAKSKRMVKKGAAKVIRRSPFTIQLKFDCGNKVQEIVLGIDTGYGTTGFSAVSEKQELISGEVSLDNMMSKRLQDRSMYRRNRRNRLWYRKPRFLNRVSTKKKGWLPPSIKRRYETHLILIEKIKKILPISKVIIEIAKFDIQKIENPDIEEKEYQQGTLYEYQNIRSYLMSREKGLCEHCKKVLKIIQVIYIIENQ